MASILTNVIVMKTKIFFLLLVLSLTMHAQGLKRVYNEDIDPLAQIDKAVEKASAASKHVMCQVGGNWCIWCLRFADFVEKDSLVNKAMHDHYEYLHVNYNPTTKEGKSKGQALLKRLGNCGRFGFPVFVVLDGEGKLLHIQDSSFLEENKGYSTEKTLRFLMSWTKEVL